MKKTAAFLLAAAIALGAFGGCSGQKPGETTAPTTTTPSLPSEPTHPLPTETTAPAETMPTDPFDPGTVPSEPEDPIMPDEPEGYSYPISFIVKDAGTIADATNKYVIAPGWHGALIDLEDLPYQGVTITKRKSAEMFGYAFLARELQVGYSPTYAKGYTRVIYSDEESVTVDVPDNARYLYVYHNSQEDNYLPEKIWFFEKETPTQSKNCIRLATWNIGHFSMGVKPNSTIKDANFSASLEKYTDFVQNGLAADVIALMEYSALFTPSNKAAESLFSDYGYGLEGQQRNYSCNALLAKVPITNVKMHEFECNKTASITHTNLITAQDYYYMTADLKIGGKTVKLVTAHLGFDKNKTPDTVNLNQIKELIATFKDEPRVIFMGDWNVREFSYFDLFTDAGFSLANEDSTLYTIYNGNLSLDNIIYKGVKISEFTLCGSELSDHYALSCTVTLP